MTCKNLALLNTHKINWDKAKLLHKEEHWFKRKFKETAFIRINNSFGSPSVEISEV